ncbi:MAG: PDZ domain-containing protein [Thermoplasmatales archaeon]|nr:PDZ domain-containing protein [Thermoplasmatales archaeon]
MKVQYVLAMEKPQTHFFNITMNIEDFTEENMLVTMPAWAPGSYEIYDFARFVRNLKAVSGENELEVIKKDKSTWKIVTRENHSIRLTYEVYANDLSVHTSQIDFTHAYLNGTSVFLYVEGYKDQSVELMIKPYSGWKISTGLEKLGENRYRAINYDILADCPIEIGLHRSLYFSVEGKEHEIVIYGHGNENEEKLKDDLKKIVEAYNRMFGHLPYKRYVFIYHLVSGDDDVIGGLEHLNSTTIDVDRFIFSPFDKYKQFLSVTSHEFFHLWNVKRIRPQELGPFNYKEENYTTMLWMAEGITNFYAYLILLRAGLIDQKEYLKHLAENMRYHDFLPGSDKTSASESSFDTWIKLYKPTPNNVNSYISYYLKGEILGFMLNTRIIEVTRGSKTLDDLFRYLMEKFNRDGKGYSEKDVINSIREVTGHDFSDFFQTYVRKPGKIDFSQELKKLGLTIRKGYRKVDGTEPERKSYLGIIVKGNGGRYIVDSVLEGSPAFEAGLNPKDEIVAINGFRFGDRFLKDLREDFKKLRLDNLADYEPDSKVRINFFRRGILMDVELTLSSAPYEYYEILDDPQPNNGSENLKSKFLVT